MKLSDAQLQRVQKFMDTEKLQYEEVKQELFDHMVALIEDELERNADQPFEEAIYAAHRSFGKNFSYIEAEYEKNLEKEINKSTWKAIYQQFTKIHYFFRTLALFVGLYGLVQISKNSGIMWLYGGIGILMTVLCFYLGIQIRRTRKKYNYFAQFKLTSGNVLGGLLGIWNIAFNLYLLPLLPDGQEPSQSFSFLGEWLFILATWVQIIIFLAIFEMFQETRKQLERNYGQA